jgi:hypothetical protein
LASISKEGFSQAKSQIIYDLLAARQYAAEPHDLIGGKVSPF